MTILQPDFSGRCHGFLVLNSSATTHSNTGYFIFYHIEITYIPQLHTAALFIYCLNQPSNISLSLFNTNASHFSDTRKYLFEGTVTNLITPEYRQSITSSTREDFFHISNIGFKYSFVVLSFVFFGVRCFALFFCEMLRTDFFFFFYIFLYIPQHLCSPQDISEKKK